jgi:signal transduction histidine kinase
MRRTAIGALVIGVLLVMGALQATNFVRARAEIEQAAEDRAANLALILAEYLSQTFAAGDAALRQLVLHGARIGGPLAPDRDWAPSLASARAGLAGIGSISVVDNDLVIRHSTIREIVGQSRQSEAFLQSAMREASNAPTLGPPFLTPRGAREYVIPLARRLTAPGGRVTGAVVATFVADDLQPFFRSVNVGEHGALWVIHHAGVLMAREPLQADRVGQSVTTHPVFQAAGRGEASGVIVGALEAGGPSSITAFRRAGALPLTVAISLDYDEVMAAWRRDAVGAAVSFAVVAGLLAVALVVTLRQMAAVARAEQLLEDTRRDEAGRLREAHAKLADTLAHEQAARREAQAANALKDQFLMTVSHELRTPLTAIAGWARMLVDGQVSGDRVEQAHRAIDRNAQAQTRLVEDLLDVAGATSGRLRLEVRPVTLDDSVRNAIEAVSQAAAAKQQEIEVRLPPGLIVAADPARLQQIIWNLVSNAVKFTPAGGRVTVSAARLNDVVEIRVSDTGDGIPPEFLPHVFESFTQRNATYSRRHSGLGLGLAIVRSLVELHGGEVTAHSGGEGAGATFVVRLPIAAKADGRRSDASSRDFAQMSHRR